MRAELSRLPPWDVLLLQAAVFGFCASPAAMRVCDQHQPWLMNNKNGGPLLWANFAGLFVSPGYFIVRADFGKPAYDDAHKARAGFERLCTQGPEIVIQ